MLIADFFLSDHLAALGDGRRGQHIGGPECLGQGFDQMGPPGLGLQILLRGDGLGRRQPAIDLGAIRLTCLAERTVNMGGFGSDQLLHPSPRCDFCQIELLDHRPERSQLAQRGIEGGSQRGL